jgi:hypothetical protein
MTETDQNPGVDKEEDEDETQDEHRDCDSDAYMHSYVPVDDRERNG